MSDKDSEWYADGCSEVLMRECDHCHQHVPCMFLRDPFIAEIHPERDNPKSWWCRPCYQDYLDEI
jgi:hypothetical protein